MIIIESSYDKIFIMSKEINKKASSIFQQATVLPEFFEENLVDDNRVVKIFKGSKVAERVFYYQLLKFIHEIQNQPEEDEEQINKSIMVKQIFSNVLSKKQGAPQNFQLQKQKNMIEHFLQLLDKNQDLCFEQYIESHPQIDDSFVSVLEAIINGQNLETTREKLAFLGQIFGLNVNQFDNCLKFQESDVFVYIAHDNQLYLAFLNIQENQQQPTSSKGNISLQKVGLKYEKEESTTRNNDHKRNDTIMNIFGDILHSSKNQVTQIPSNNMLNGNLLNNSYNMTPKKDAFAKIEQQSIQEQDYESQNKKTNVFPKFKHEQSNVESFCLHKEQEKKQEQRESKYKEQQINSFAKKIQKIETQKQDIFYNPKPKKPFMTEYDSKNSSKIRKKDPLDYQGPEEKGTFYRQFTETRILNILPEPQRSKVKMMKNRFIGVHSKLPKRI